MAGADEQRPTGQASTHQHRLGSLLVGAQFTLIGLCLLPVGPTIGREFRALGLLLLALAAVVGVLALLALGAHTRIHPQPHRFADLRTSGIYGVLRHPMYTAVLLACLGVTVSTARVLSIVALVGLVVVLTMKYHLEDRMLEQRFGAPFAAYRDTVPALVPRPRRGRRS